MATYHPTESGAMHPVNARIIPPHLKEVLNMENLDVILQAISTTGFPIMISLILLWYVNKQLETHKEETNGLKDVIRENTVAIAKLTLMIEGKKNND